MKKIFFALILLFVSSLAFAENWLNDSKILSSSVEAYSLRSECEKVTGEKCYDLGVYPSSIYSRGYIEIDDYSKPKYTKSQIESCESIENCDFKFLGKVCPTDRDLIKNYDILQVYCSKLIGYEKKSEATVVLDTVKFQAWQLLEEQKATRAQNESFIQLALKKIECGERVIALLVVRNQPKGLTPAQIAQMNLVYAPIKGLLGTASLVTAKEHIESVTADGVMITEADKVALSLETQKCIELN